MIREIFQVVGVIMTLLSMCSIIAYNCHFHDGLIQSPEGYMFHLVYFRSHHCNSFIDWSVVTENMKNLVEPELPHETEPVTRTFWIAVCQLIVNLLLVLTSLSMIGENLV